LTVYHVLRPDNNILKRYSEKPDPCGNLPAGRRPITVKEQKADCFVPYTDLNNEIPAFAGIFTF